MNDVIQELQETLTKQLHQNDFDVVGIVPIPAELSDKGTSIQTLSQVLKDFDQTDSPETIKYLLQIRPKGGKSTSKAAPQASSQNLDGIYLPNGRINVHYLFKNADLLFEAGDYGLARNIITTILQSGEFTGTALHKLGKCFEAEGKLDEAKTHYEQSITFHPSLDTYQKLVAILVRQNKDQQAAEVCERALNLKSISQKVRFEIHKSAGNCWTRVRKMDEAERNFKKALDINPAADDVRANLGALYLQAGKVTEAKRHFQDALASNPKNHFALSGLGSCSLTENDKKAAHDLFTQSLEIEINNPTAIFYLVKTAYEIKVYNSAARILENYIQIAPVNTNLLYSLAGLQFHLGRIQEAKKTTLQILNLQKDHHGANELIKLIDKYGVSSV